MIHDCPSKIYLEAVPFSPSSSWLHDYYSADFLQGVKVVKGLQAGWGVCSRTVLLDSTPFALACWNNLIAAGLSSGNITTLNVTTGICISNLSGHTACVRSLAFLSDGTSIVSGSDDGTVRLWDIQTGGVVRVFYGHSDMVWSISISPDQTMIASASADKTVRLWNAQTGECCCTIRHNNVVYTANFSPTNSKLLISASSGGVVQQWNINGHKIGLAYEGWYAAFSPDGTHIVSWIPGVTVRDSNSGVIVTKLQTLSSDVQHCCFSPNGKFVVGASSTVIYIWDITSLNPHLIKCLVGHTRSITSIAFSSTLFSSSNDRSIKFWQIDDSSTNKVLADTKSRPLSSTPIMTLSVHARDCAAISSDRAGLVRVWDISTGLCKASATTSAGPHSHRDIQLIDGELLIVWCTHELIHIWDTKKVNHPKIVGARFDFSTTSIRISGDGSRVFLLDREHIQALSIQTGKVVGKVRLEGEPSNHPLTVDGLRVWVYFKSLPTRWWDFGIPSSTSTGLSSPPLVTSRLDFIHSTTEGTTTKLFRVKDTFTGKEIFQMSGRYIDVAKMQCDGQYLVASYESGELLILDFGLLIPQ